MYQGHMSDGSSVQKHSAGPTYPYVVYTQETERGMAWGVVGMGVDTSPCFDTEEAATDRAAVLRKDYLARTFIRDHADWSVDALLRWLKHAGHTVDEARRHLRNFVDAQCSR